MCSPEAFQAGFGATGGVVGAYGSVADGVMKNRYYQDLAKTQEMNATLAEQAGERDAQMIQLDAAQDLKNVRLQGKQVAASQRVALAVNGVGAGSATAEDLARDALSHEQKDDMAIRYSADMKSWQAKSDAKFKAWDLRNQARQSLQAGYAAKTNADIGAVTSLLGGATQVASAFKRDSSKKESSGTSRGMGHRRYGEAVEE